MTESTSERARARLHGPLFAEALSHDSPRRVPPPRLAHLAAPTWADVDDARVRYESESRRLRRWQWWFVAMFALYATLAGILLLTLALGR